MEVISAVEVWVIAHYKIISFAFGLLAAVGVGAGMVYKTAIVMRNTRLDKEAYKDAVNAQLVALSHEVALFNQRQEFQSEFMSYQEERYNELQKQNRSYGEALVNYAIDAALVKQLLTERNITAKP